MNLTLILFLNFFVPTQIVIPNTIGDVVNSGGKLVTYKVLDRFNDSILLSSNFDNNLLKDTILVHRDLLNFRIYYDSPSILSFTDENGISLGADTITDQNENIFTLPKRRAISRDHNFINSVDTICFLVSPERRQAKFPINSVFGIVNDRVYVLDYTYLDSVSDFCFRSNRIIQSYDQLKEVIGKMISYRDMNFDSERNFTLTKAYQDFIDYSKTEDLSYNDLEMIGTNLVFVSKTFDRIKERKLKNRLIGFYELDEFALSKFPRYIRFRHIDIMPINDTNEFRRAIISVIKNKHKDDSSCRIVNQFILNFLNEKEGDSTIRELVNKLLSTNNLDYILFEKDIRLIRNWLE